MIKKSRIKNNNFTIQSNGKIKKSKKKKRSKKGLVRINKLSTRRSKKKTPHSKLKNHKQDGGGWNFFGTSCSDKINIRKLKKKVKDSNKQLTEVKNTTKSFIDRMKLEKQNDLFQRTYNLYKKQLIIMIRKEVYSGFIPTLSDITKEKLKVDVDVSSYKSINEQQSEIDSTNTILTEISTKAYDLSLQYDKVVDANKFQIDNYKRNDIKRKKVLYTFYKNLYKYYTGSSKIKFGRGKNDFDYTKHNLMSEIFLIKEKEKKEKKEKKGKKEETYIKNLLIKGNSKAEIIAFYKVELGEDGNEPVKSLEIIQKMKKEKEYENNNKLYKYEKKFATCQKQFREKIKAHNELYESMSKLIEEDNNLQRNMGNMSTHFRNIKIRIGEKTDVEIKKLFNYKKGSGSKWDSDTEHVTVKCIKAIFYLAPVKFDAELEEKHKDIIKKYEDKINNNIINYKLLNNIEDNLNQINNIVQQIDNQEHRSKIVLDLNRAKTIFKHCKKLYNGIKTDLKNFKDSFLFIGKDKSKETNETVYLLKIINSIIKSHYEGIMTLFKLKCYMEVFKNEKYREKFTGLLSVTEQWANNPMKRIQYEQGMRKSVQPNSTTSLQTNYTQPNMRYPTPQNMRYPTPQNMRYPTMTGGYYKIKEKKEIPNSLILSHKPNISYIYGYINILEKPLELTNFDELTYDSNVDNLDYPFQYPVLENSNYRIITKSIAYLKTFYPKLFNTIKTIDEQNKITLYINELKTNNIIENELISKIVRDNETTIFKPFQKLEDSIFNFFNFIGTYDLKITTGEEYEERFSGLIVSSIFMKKLLYNNYEKEDSYQSIRTNNTLNIFELEGEIDNLFNWFIYVNKLIKNMDKPPKSFTKKEETDFYKKFYNKNI